ncbi:MAG: ribosome maturation factor RimP [Bdellovibrionales bacterium]|nr:ribosome maturation factor RimP [Bdellovibrionales bacterium]
MLSSDVMERLEALAQEICVNEGCILYDLEFVGHGGQRTLRVFADKKDKQESISVDECADISRGLSLVLDVEDVIPGDKYELEISSPGLERRLSRTWHFQRYLGEEIEVKSSAPIEVPEGKKPPKGAVRQIRGVLRQADDESLVIEKDQTLWTVPRDIVHRAKLIFDFGGQSHTKPGPKKKPNKGKTKR